MRSLYPPLILILQIIPSTIGAYQKKYLLSCNIVTTAALFFVVVVVVIVVVVIRIRFYPSAFIYRLIHLFLYYLVYSSSLFQLSNIKNIWWLDRGVLGPRRRIGAEWI
jgi:hypothetical protein